MTLPWSDPIQTLDESEKFLIERQWLTIRILWGSLLLALAVYVIIAHVIGTEGAVGIEPEPGDPWWLAYFPAWVFGAISPVLLIAALLVRRAASRPASLVRRFTSAYLNAAIVAWALCEAVGIFGLVTFLMVGEFRWLYIFVGASAVVQVLLRPRKREIIDEVIRSRPSGDS
jgi:hypothetical protein